MTSTLLNQHPPLMAKETNWQRSENPAITTTVIIQSVNTNSVNRIANPNNNSNSMCADNNVISNTVFAGVNVK